MLRILRIRRLRYLLRTARLIWAALVGDRILIETDPDLAVYRWICRRFGRDVRPRRRHHRRGPRRGSVQGRGVGGGIGAPLIHPHPGRVHVLAEGGPLRHAAAGADFSLPGDGLAVRRHRGAVGVGRRRSYRNLKKIALCILDTI